MTNINILAKQGYKSIIITFISALVFEFIISCGFIATLLYILCIALIFIYRNPERNAQSNQNEFLAPIDGTVNSIDIKDGKKYLFIDVSLFDTHLFRSPVDSSVKITSYKKGLNLSSFKYKAKKLNEKMVLDFGKLKVKLLSGAFNTSLDFKEKNNVAKGERIGVFLNGTVILEMQKDEKLFVQIGDKVKAGETILGAFKAQ